MKKALIGIAAGAALTFSAGAAYADGYGYGSVKDAMAPQQVNWNGLYIGAAVGYGIASTELDYRSEYYDYDLDDWYGGAANLDGISSHGFQGVVTLGYDRQIHPNVVLGIFADYAIGDLETKASITDFDGDGLRFKADVADSWAIGARLGFVRSCCSMWYLAAGYAQADLDWNISAIYEGEVDGSISGGKKLSGWFIGGGVEHQLRENLFLKFDYRYTAYDTERLFGYVYDNGFDYESQSLDEQTSVHSVRLGVNWKVDLFHGHHASAAPLK